MSGPMLTIWIQISMAYYLAVYPYFEHLTFPCSNVENIHFIVSKFQVILYDNTVMTDVQVDRNQVLLKQNWPRFPKNGSIACLTFRSDSTKIVNNRNFSILLKRLQII